MPRPTGRGREEVDSAKKVVPMDGRTHIGARIAYFRKGLLTQQELADRAGVSVDLIRKLEQGRKHIASIPYLHRIARALDVDISALLAKPTTMPSDDPNAGIVGIRTALTAVDDLLDEITEHGDPADVDEAHRVVQYAWGSYWAGRLDLLTSILPAGLAQLRATAWAAPERHRAQAHQLLADLYTVTRCTATRLGQPDLAWLAIRNALDSVRRGSDELLHAMVRSSVSHQLLTQGRYDEAHRVALHAAAGIEPVGDVPLPHLSAYGHLLLMAASAAARDQQVSEATDLLAASMECAKRLGVDRNDYETSFGLSQATMQSLDVHVVTENFEAALAAADRIPRDTRLPIVLRARGLYDRALAHTRLGHDERALDAVLAAETMAPDLMRYHALPRLIVDELQERHRARNPRLTKLARRLAVYDRSDLYGD
jgi:transcriptional regulator with XRE-family HTH domain